MVDHHPRCCTAHKTMEAWSKQLLLNAIDDEHLVHLKDDILGHQPVSVRDTISFAMGQPPLAALGTPT